MVSDALMDDSIRASWARLDTRFPLVEAIFPACMADAQSALTPDGLSAFLEAGRIIGKLGRGAEPLLAFLEAWPSTARAVGEDLLAPVMAVVQGLQKSPNGRAITPFLQTLAPVAQRLQAGEQLQHYLDLTLDLMARTTRSIHGFHTTYPSPGLPDFFNQAPTLLAQLDIGGLQRWVDYGVRNYATHPERQKDYFSLQSADARAVLQRERHGTLLVDVERHLDLYLRALWRDGDLLIPYSTAFDELRKPVPYYDPLGIRLPDVQDDAFGVSGLDRYRAMLAHIVGHRRWSTPQIADNWSPFQRMAVEFFEDCRVETLLIREYAGLRRLFLALHPRPVEDACNPETTSCLRHRLAMLSRALLDPEHGYRDADLNTFVAHFHALMAQGASSTRDIAVLALAYVAKTRRQSDQFAKVHFENTVIDYRDDNRHLWRFIEQGDEEERFDETRRNDAQDDLPRLPPRHYPEWDYHSQTYRPDWVSVYEGLHPSAQAGDIDRLLQKHAPLAKRLQRLLELLKPQDKVRIRYQEEGSELDLDVAIRSLIDFKAGSNPDPRINLSHRTNGRDIAVTLLLDLSASLNDKVKGSEQTILELSQEAVSLLAWAIERLGDPLAIAGFQSNTRHEVRYLHIKGFGEPWGDEVKARLAAMQANYSTRMGAALRHAAHSLRARKSDKKLLLILTDGEPADIDVQDERLLIEDARQAVRELELDGLFTFCISLDPRADAYVSDIFGRRYTVIDNIERLPERLPEVFLALTK
ncbi:MULTISPECIES: nitric oxide reductase activation protein NorD [unclassified Thiomonas]|uniref:nitric oxide reductase activation protein NorD n=1 Tax=unclassified Thiomonas TaxID=2625466 RepID=UPI0004DB9CFB|nr:MULTISPECIES: VWA domain-containing protein [unclassified Thiomonas]CDW95833.1 von Willebrand factor type A [Thiomonas sp. CB2]VDY03277.1 von Willebrand factor type A [Thiomonas sp. Bio17B3]VDY09548.1 von Willebrand factor type A [Thiomonas sp. Sup16B3]VDY11527.1 putative Rubisco activation protein CbbO [Thiomonas sp. OC7]VDY19260.1 von Willebrand factor type A [Thiomonas sp. CB2]